jgi:hypothetical protein
MPPTWEQLVADWATDNGIGLTGAILQLSGTPGWLEAKQRCRDGAAEKVVRHLLDAALAATGYKHQTKD